MMSSRREFLRRASVSVPVAATGLFLATGSESVAEEVEHVGCTLGQLPKNIIYSEAHPGIWKGKAGSHLPSLKVSGSKGEIITKHGMSSGHYIVRHSLVSTDGQVIFGHTFSPDDDEAVSTFDGGKVEAGKTYFVMSFCNKHDLWMAHIKV